MSFILEKIQLYIGILKTEDCPDDCEEKKKKPQPTSPANAVGISGNYLGTAHRGSFFLGHTKRSSVYA